MRQRLTIIFTFVVIIGLLVHSEFGHASEAGKDSGL
jgi:hypothetical protein